MDAEHVGICHYPERGPEQAWRSGSAAWRRWTMQNEQDLNLACIKLPEQRTCVWALNPSFAQTPYEAAP
ncbi:hypothetical protein LGH83_05390 [Lichenihabitans sp. PAMC28606]|uniref:hypothetical protein n=1 Tax=Lichenihabitans sp. PAMC28606 TaxID=2880932 RepID=UPI001D09F3FD|nr:hypothetical protein [Lichenihabitans sp. PAMC28606]UDL95649.1 hypothetical protein LGH83_05390 [Lichenihabitans sp. PAMC28606]